MSLFNDYSYLTCPWSSIYTWHVTFHAPDYLCLSCHMFLIIYTCYVLGYLYLTCPWLPIPDMFTWHVPDCIYLTCSWLSIPDMFLIINTRNVPDCIYLICPWLSIPDMPNGLIFSIPDMPPIIQKYVFRFTISVNYSFLVQVPQTKQYFSGIESRQEISKILTGNLKILTENFINLDKKFQESR